MGKNGKEGNKMTIKGAIGLIRRKGKTNEEIATNPDRSSLLQ